MVKKQQGFTLFEVLVSMFIAGVALLGLAMLEIRILQSSQSSFNYTVSTIRANSYIDGVWMDLCNLQNTPAAYDNYRNTFVNNELVKYGLSLDTNSATVFSSTSNHFTVQIGWEDTQFTDKVSGNQNSVSLQAEFPVAPSPCS